MKKQHKFFIMALVASQLFSVMWLLPLSLGYFHAIPGDITSILSVVLRLDGVLFGFSLTVYSFLSTRTEDAFTDWANAFVAVAFASFFYSILYGFIGLLNGENGSPIATLLAISSTLSGIITLMAFFIQFSVGAETKEEEKE